MSENTRGVIRGQFAGIQGVSRWSDFTAAQMPTRPTGPAAPSNVTATGSILSVTVDWDAPTKDAASEGWTGRRNGHMGCVARSQDEVEKVDKIVVPQEAHYGEWI